MSNLLVEIVTQRYIRTVDGLAVDALTEIAPLVVPPSDIDRGFVGLIAVGADEWFEGLEAGQEVEELPLGQLLIAGVPYASDPPHVLMIPDVVDDQPSLMLWATDDGVQLHALQQVLPQNTDALAWLRRVVQAPLNLVNELRAKRCSYESDGTCGAVRCKSNCWPEWQGDPNRTTRKYCRCG